MKSIFFIFLAFIGLSARAAQGDSDTDYCLKNTKAAYDNFLAQSDASLAIDTMKALLQTLSSENRQLLVHYGQIGARNEELELKVQSYSDVMYKKPTTEDGIIAALHDEWQARVDLKTTSAALDAQKDTVEAILKSFLPGANLPENMALFESDQFGANPGHVALSLRVAIPENKRHTFHIGPVITFGSPEFTPTDIVAVFVPSQIGDAFSVSILGNRGDQPDAQPAGQFIGGYLVANGCYDKLDDINAHIAEMTQIKY